MSNGSEGGFTLLETARSVMTADMPPCAELAPGALSGQVNDHQWRIDVGPLGEGWAVPGADVAWIPALAAKPTSGS
jgi:general secretion pathway protein I